MDRDISTSDPLDLKLKALTFSLILMVVDRAVKIWVLSNFSPMPAYMKAPGFLSIGLFMNEGIAFSALKHYPTVVLLLSLIVALTLFGLFLFNPSLYKASCMPWLLAGTFGNLMDRFLYGSVVDWLYVGVFINLADIFIIWGIILLLFEVVKKEKNKTKKEA